MTFLIRSKIFISVTPFPPEKRSCPSYKHANIKGQYPFIILQPRILFTP